MQIARHVPQPASTASGANHVRELLSSTKCVRPHRATRHGSAMQGSTATQPVPVKAAALPGSRQAWHITKQGDMSSLKLIDESMPALQPGEVLVEVKALGLNFAGVGHCCCIPVLQTSPFV
eukprot:GHUV01037996.1.p1 GENE.GHUV01037996.1~~GHUV01037996.1.p1  ORF type:complete len:121 (+),score=20.32 GHUV01037996.1:620-982(+)